MLGKFCQANRTQEALLSGCGLAFSIISYNFHLASFHCCCLRWAKVPGMHEMRLSDLHFGIGIRTSSTESLRLCAESTPAAASVKYLALLW